MSDNADATEAQAEEDFEVAILWSRNTAAREIDELQEFERACRESAALHHRVANARRREERALEKAVEESLLRVTGHRRRYDGDYREYGPPLAARRRRHKASASNSHTLPSVMLAEEAAATSSLECAVCLEELRSAPCARLRHRGIFACSHVLHAECAERCFNGSDHGFCPFCRKEFDELQYI